ncbi:MAG TPA: response regulator, partial [Chitinispirillaceae bacterium]|nr:response regulator [Chitinispirillaceae bacterium]
MSTVHEQLILLISEDLTFCTSISSHMVRIGLKVILSHEQNHALDIFEKLHPCIVLTDLKSPRIDGLKILEAIKIKSSIPVLITATAKEIMNFIEPIQFHGGDYILKPIQSNLLCRRLVSLLSPSFTINDKNIASMIGSIHSVHDTIKLFELAYSICMEISRAQFGLLHFYNKETRILAAVQPTDRSATMHSVLTGNDEWAIPSWVFFNKQSIEVRLGKASPEMEADLYRCKAASALSLPFGDGGDFFGVLTVFWNENDNKVDDIIVGKLKTVLFQTSVAYNNLVKVAIVNQKLDELILVSSYSEKLMGLVDKYDIIKSLFETTFLYFPIDIIGFLVVQKRSHEFLYWSRSEIEEKKNSRKSVKKQSTVTIRQLLLIFT